MQAAPELQPAELPSSAPVAPAQDRRALWLEVVAVLFVGVLPDLWNTVYQTVWPKDIRWAAGEIYAHLLFRSAHVGMLVLYLMARSGTPWSCFGIVPLRRVIDPLLSFAILVADRFAYALYAAAVVSMVPAEALTRDTEPLGEMFQRPDTPGVIALMVAASIANGFAEELVMRGYLIPRFEDLLESSLKAVLLTSVLFAGYHLYQGLYGAGSALVLGLIYGTVFCRIRRLWPLAAAHALYDVAALMR